MRKILFHNPGKIVFGTGSLEQMTEDFMALGFTRLYILTVPFIIDQISSFVDTLYTKGISTKINQNIQQEPTFSDFKEILAEAQAFNADSIAGIGGGSVMDMAKIVAALLYSDQDIQSVVGTGLLKERKTFLICMPTTSGTGSEVSPNSILIDDTKHSKKGIISPLLVPDRTYVDPSLTLSLPATVTAYTGMDALTHCIEAYANINAHPMVDTLALDGIRLISRSLMKAVSDGQDLEARSELALGSFYGGMCLGPVNTAAVHALAYPLGTMFKTAHGLSNAVLLPHVMEFNLSAAERRYAEIAIALGVNKDTSDHKTAGKGIAFIKKLISKCNLPVCLSDIGIPYDAIENMAKSAMEVQRLLKNNVRQISEQDVIQIYKAAYQKS